MPAQGTTLTEAARLSAQAADELRRRDLLVSDEPAPRAAGLLNAVAHPVAQVDVRWARGADVPELRGLVALRGKNGVLALRDGESVILRSVKHAMFAEELVAVATQSCGLIATVSDKQTLNMEVTRVSAQAPGRGDPCGFAESVMGAAIKNLPDA